MNKVFLVVAFLLSVFISSVNASAVPSVWRWIDRYDEHFYRINFKNHTFERQAINSNSWEVLGKVNLVDFVEADRSPNVELPHVVPLNPDRRDSLYVQIPGTGQVYLFTTHNFTLTRLDRTYYRGYNFNACFFIRKGDLYSVGGYGFWNQSNAITVYLPRAGEWQIVVPESKAPPYITGDVTQYVLAKDLILSTLNPILSTFHNDYTGRPDSTYWEFHFADREWKKKGVVNQELVNHIGGNIYNYTSFVVGGDKLFITFSDPVYRLTLYYANLSTNKLYRYPLTHKIEASDSLMVTQTKLLINENFSTYRTGDLTVLPFDEIIKKSVLVGDFVDEFTDNQGNKQSVFLWGILVTAGSLGALGFWVVNKKRVAAEPIQLAPKDSLSELTELENRALNVLLIRYPSPLSVDALHRLLALEGKTLDNQRKLRNEFLNAINTKLKLIIHEEESIIRVANEKDRRINDYVLKKEAWEKLHHTMSGNGAVET